MPAPPPFYATDPQQTIKMRDSGDWRRNEALAQLLQQDAQRAQVQSPWEGALRLGQVALSGLHQKRAKEGEQQEMDALQRVLMENGYALPEGIDLSMMPPEVRNAMLASALAPKEREVMEVNGRLVWKDSGELASTDFFGETEVKEVDGQLVQITPNADGTVSAEPIFGTRKGTGDGSGGGKTVSEDVRNAARPWAEKVMRNEVTIDQVPQWLRGGVEYWTGLGSDYHPPKDEGLDADMDRQLDAWAARVRAGEDPATFVPPEYLADVKARAENTQREGARDVGVQLMGKWKQVADDYLVVKRNFMTIENGYNQKDGAGDIAMVFGFMKMLDPPSTVREGEFAKATDTGGLLQKMEQWAAQIERGDQLSQEQRESLITLARTQLGGYQRDYTTAYNQFAGYSDAYGVPVDMYLYDPFGWIAGTPQSPPNDGPGPDFTEE